MARVLDIARRLAWEHRREYGADTAPRRQWCVDAWAGSKLTDAQVQAAHKLWAMIEGGYSESAIVGYDRVDGGLADPHARLAAAREKRYQVEGVMRFLASALESKPHLRRVASLLFDPHAAQLTVQELCAEIGCGKATARAAGYCARVLDQVAIYFCFLDRDEKKWAERALTDAG